MEFSSDVWETCQVSKTWQVYAPFGYVQCEFCRPRFGYAQCKLCRQRCLRSESC